MGRGDWEAARPALTEAESLILEAWSFMGGWHPEQFELAAEYLRITDVEALIDGCLTIREAIEENKRAQQT